MTEKPFEQVIKDLADKIRADLPEELAAAVHFEGDEKGNLFMDFAVHLDKADYPLVLGVVKKFNGDFVNRKENGRDVGCFFIPKPKPVATIVFKPEGETADLSKVASPAPSTPAEAKLQEQAKAPSDAKPEQALQQPSPLSLYQSKNCSTCEDIGLCKLDSSRMILCLRVMNLQYLDFLFERLHKIGQGLDANGKFLSQVLENTVSRSATQHSTVPQPQSTPVQRNTRPIEGHMESGIVWVFDENQKGERYEKAFEKDNLQSSPYFGLRDRIVEVVNQGKKGLVDNGKWIWLSDREDYIGRKPAKQFSKGNRH
jgi:hypothetical protein